MRSKNDHLKAEEAMELDAEIAEKCAVVAVSEDKSDKAQEKPAAEFVGFLFSFCIC